MKPGDTGLTSETEQGSSLSSPFKVIAGSYRRLLYYLQGTVSASSPDASSELEWTLKPIFIFPARVSYIKTVAASPQGGKWLATGSGGDIIKVRDLRRRKGCRRTHAAHEGSTAPSPISHSLHARISSSESRTLCVFRTCDWAVLRSLKGHKDASVHPPGKVVCAGKDRTLYTSWDLMRERRAASMKLGFEGELVRWSASGSLLIVQSQKPIDVYPTSYIPSSMDLEYMTSSSYEGVGGGGGYFSLRLKTK